MDILHTINFKIEHDNITEVACSRLKNILFKNDTIYINKENFDGIYEYICFLSQLVTHSLEL